MSAALRNRLRRVEKELAVREAASEGQLLQIQKAALASLSDGDLRYLRVGGSPTEPAPVASYRAACEAAAVRFTGRSCPALELSSDAVAQEIANRSGSKLHAMFPDEGPYRRELYPATWSFSRRVRVSASVSSWPPASPAQPRPARMNSLVTCPGNIPPGGGASVSISPSTPGPAAPPTAPRAISCKTSCWERRVRTAPA